MNILKKTKVSFFLLFTLFTLNLEAIPTFARQYDMACSSCHTQVPALNDMGLNFLRNGFRSSKGDITALNRLFDSNSTNRHYPVSVIAGLSADSDGGEVGKIMKLYLAGSITDSLSIMANTKETFNDSSNEQRLFQTNNSSLYLQYNLQESKQALRVGLLKPLTQLGNIQRSTAGAGLNFAGNQYRTPLRKTGIKSIKGAEYSYLSESNILLLASYGETVDNQSQRNPKNPSKQIVDEDSYSFLGAIGYTTKSNYKMGLIYHKVDEDNSDKYSLLLPIEKEYYELLVLNSSIVYIDDSDNGDYLGIENAVTFPLRDMEHIKLVFNADKDENDNKNYGYSIGYSKIYKMFLFTVNAAHIDAEEFNDNQLSGSISIVF